MRLLQFCLVAVVVALVVYVIGRAFNDNAWIMVASAPVGVAAAALRLVIIDAFSKRRDQRSD